MDVGTLSSTLTALSILDSGWTFWGQMEDLEVEDQSHSGKMCMVQVCSSCHGSDLSGRPLAPVPYSLQ